MIDPITRASRLPSGFSDNSVYRPFCAVITSAIWRSPGSTPTPQMPHSLASPVSSRRSTYIAWCAR
jgi:hypothetical protein